MKLVIAEKPSVAMALASVLGARTRKDLIMFQIIVRDIQCMSELSHSRDSCDGAGTFISCDRTLGYADQFCKFFLCQMILFSLIFNLV